MKFSYVLVFLFYVSGIKANESESFRNEKFEKYDDFYGSIIDTKSYSEDDLFRPCALTDWQCMRKFLASNSDCRPSYGPVPDPIILPVEKMYFPSANLTVTHKDLQVRGFRSAKITEFYFNKATGNLVIAVNVQKLNLTSSKSYFSFQRTAKEPIVLSDYISAVYDSATFTAVIPKVPHLQLEGAEIHGDIHDAVPVYFVGPQAYNSTDPNVIASYTALVSNIPTSIQEAFVFHSSLLTSIYIQSYLCDFGLDSYKNYLSYIRTKGYIQASGDNYSDKRNKYYESENVYNRNMFYGNSERIPQSSPKEVY